MAAVWTSRACRAFALVLITVGVVATAGAFPLMSADVRPEYRPAAYAIKGARVVVSPEVTVDPGTVIVRDGIIEKVGKADEVPVPYDAETIDGEGLVVYPGFLDLYTTLGQASGTTRSQTGAGRTVPYSDYALAHTPPDNRSGLTPEFQMASALDLPESAAADRRKLGFTDLLAAPAGSIATGQSALVSLSGLPRREAIVQAPIALHVSLRPPFEPPPPPGPDESPAVARRRLAGLGALGYPMSLMGVVAHLRQAMLDAEHDHALREFYAQARSRPRLPYDPALQALYAASTGQIAVWWEANTRDEILRALDLSEEFGTRPVIVGGREAGKVAAELKARNVPVVLRLDFPSEPEVPTEAEYRKRDPEKQAEPLKVLADRAAKWKERVATAKTLAAAGVRFGFSTDGLSKVENFPGQLRKVIGAGLPASAALTALTKNAAEIAEVGARLGTIEPGKLGHLVVLSGPLGEESTQVRYVLADGLRFEVSKAAPARSSSSSKSKERKSSPASEEPKAKTEEPKAKAEPARAKAEPARTKSEAPAAAKAEVEKAEPRKTEAPKAEPPKAEAAKPEAAKPEAAKAAAGAEAPRVDQCGPQDESKTDKTDKDKGEKEAVAQAAQTKDAQAAQTKDAQPAQTKDAPATKTQTPPAQPAPATSTQETTRRPAQTGATAAPPKNEEDQPPSSPFVDVATEFDADRAARLKTGGNVLIRDVTILTVSNGTIPRGYILIRDGKIAAVGGGTMEPPAGLKVIQAPGLVAMPGIIDTHSHMAIAGGVNEMSLSIVPEVRVRDAVSGDDPTIFRALAGGVTAARLLHGSADTIGGQDTVIKLRFGQAGRDLVLHDGDQGVKFALGENVTRRTGRFPNTRMGVEATIERAFEEARAYQAEWDAYRAAKARGESVPPPRRDLRLEALAGVLAGTVKIHSHCYRSDEILMLLRIATRHGVKVQSLQHVLEGYKVAAEIAAHGASASTFSDWWAYKVEAYDAIPYNSALLAQAGVQVCIKSDDEELVRHLNLEAAKMIKYGGVSEAQALEMITLNPARQLGLEHRLGSIEVGKDADIVLFNAHPFDGFARCELALIDGEVFFQRREPGDKLAPRPGEHVAHPSATAEAIARRVEIPTNPAGTYALTGATLHPISGPAIPNGTLVIAAGKIAAIGGADTPVPAGAQTLDLRGLDVWPGMVDAGSILGLWEVGSLAETQDFADSATFEPELRTSTALHPDSELIPVARANGILTSYVQPSGGTISGQGCVIDLHGWVPSEMVLADAAALNIVIPRQLPGGEGFRGRFNRPEPGAAERSTDPGQQRRDRLDAIREMFKRALAYDRVAAEARARKAPLPPPDPRLASLIPYAKGEKIVILMADHRGEILDALKLASDLKLKAVISGGLEAWKVTDALKAAKVPVLVGGTLRLPASATDPYDAPYANPARLHEAGIVFGIKSGGRGPNQATAGRNLPYEAAVAVAYGLPEDVALTAVTLTPAQILGVADRVGSLDPGKRANLVITAGHLLQPTTDVKALFIGGKPVAPESRHTRLYAKYQQRLAEVRAGTAPLGIEIKPPTLLAPSGSPAPATSPASGQGAGDRR